MFAINALHHFAKNKTSQLVIFKIRHAKWRPIHTGATPAIWDDMKGENVKRIEVLPSSSEYHIVVQKFTQTLTLNAVTLHRIQNITLWKQFQEQKKKIEKKIPNQLVTRELLHGTDVATSEKILKDIFDRSHAGKNGKFGKGVYFATTALYSNGFAREDSQGNRCMFLAEVITGTYCPGSRSSCAVPMQEDNRPFDSVVNQINNPTCFAIFRDMSAYPLYLFTYQV